MVILVNIAFNSWYFLQPETKLEEIKIINVIMRSLYENW